MYCSLTPPPLRSLCFDLNVDLSVLEGTVADLDIVMTSQERIISDLKRQRDVMKSDHDSRHAELATKVNNLFLFASTQDGVLINYT